MPSHFTRLPSCVLVLPDHSQGSVSQSSFILCSHLQSLLHCTVRLVSRTFSRKESPLQTSPRHRTAAPYTRSFLPQVSRQTSRFHGDSAERVARRQTRTSLELGPGLTSTSTDCLDSFDPASVYLTQDLSVHFATLLLLSSLYPEHLCRSLHHLTPIYLSGRHHVCKFLATNPKSRLQVPFEFWRPDQHRR